VWTVLFPQVDLAAQGGVRDPAIHARLRQLDWTVPFVRDYLAGGYTRSRLEPSTPLPWVVLQTPDGRALFREAFGPDTAAALERAIDEHFAEGEAPGTASP
jgi:hypothetical protein